MQYHVLPLKRATLLEGEGEGEGGVKEEEEAIQGKEKQQAILKMK